MKTVCMILALMLMGLSACDRVREDDARKGVPQTGVTHSQDKPGGNVPAGGVGAKDH